MTDLTTLTPAELDRMAAEQHAIAMDSWERSDTDGCLTQWAANLTGRQYARQAQIAENGGMAEFPALFTLTGEWVPAKAIQTRYGTRWMVLDSDGNRTGEFLPHLPARRRTLADKGYLEGYALWPAKAVVSGTGKGLSGLTTCHVATVKACADHVPPAEITTTDRWAD